MLVRLSVSRVEFENGGQRGPSDQVFQGSDLSFFKSKFCPVSPLSLRPFSPDGDSTELRWWEVTTPPLVATGHHPGYIARFSSSSF